MEDQTIVDLYWARDEQAIRETDAKYGRYCRSIAQNILHNPDDTEECLNDTWLNTWNSLPPQRPSILSSYLGTITRNLSLSRCRADHAQKRRGDRLHCAYEELQESIPGSCNAEEEVAVRELGEAVDRFLRAQSQVDACIFLRRYWYLDTMQEIAGRCRLTEASVKTRLHRIRKRLRTYLEQEGYTL